MGGCEGRAAVVCTVWILGLVGQLLRCEEVCWRAAGGVGGLVVRCDVWCRVWFGCRITVGVWVRSKGGVDVVGCGYLVLWELVIFGNRCELRGWGGRMDRWKAGVW